MLRTSGCKLQLYSIDEYDVTPSYCLSDSCSLCRDYVFPTKFRQEQCFKSNIVNETGERVVICHCLGWLNEYLENGLRCYEGELVLQSNILWNEFIKPVEFDVLPFDICIRMNRNPTLMCRQHSPVRYYSKVDFKHMMLVTKDPVEVYFSMDEECSLHLLMIQNGEVLKFNDSTRWGYDDTFPEEYNESRCYLEKPMYRVVHLYIEVHRFHSLILEMIVLQAAQYVSSLLFIQQCYLSSS